MNFAFCTLAPRAIFPHHQSMPGQTKSVIRALLAGAGLAPQQRYGQNFLIDLNLMGKLVAAAELQPEIAF